MFICRSSSLFSFSPSSLVLTSFTGHLFCYIYFWFLQTFRVLSLNCWLRGLQAELSTRVFCLFVCFFYFFFFGFWAPSFYLSKNVFSLDRTLRRPSFKFKLNVFSSSYTFFFASDQCLLIQTNFLFGAKCLLVSLVPSFQLRLDVFSLSDIIFFTSDQCLLIQTNFLFRAKCLLVSSIPSF